MAFRQLFALGLHPTERAVGSSPRFLPRPQRPQTYKGVSLAPFAVGRRRGAQCRRDGPGSHGMCLHGAPCELPCKIPSAKPEFPPNADCSAQTGLVVLFVPALHQARLCSVGFMGAAAVSPHRNPALSIRVRIPCPVFSAKIIWEPGKVQALEKPTLAGDAGRWRRGLVLD